MYVETKFELGDVLFRTTDPEQWPMQVVAIQVDFNGVNYLVSNGCGSTYLLFAAQLSKEKNTVLTSTN